MSAIEIPSFSYEPIHIVLNHLIAYLIILRITFSLFWESAHFFSLIILSQLICSVIYLACIIFHLDLVINTILCLKNVFFFSHSYTDTNLLYFNSATETSGFHYNCISFGGISDWPIDSFWTLLLWTGHHEQFWNDGRMFVRMQLAKPTDWIEKVFDYDDEKCPTTDLLSWIQFHNFKLGNILQSMNVIYFKRKLPIQKWFFIFLISSIFLDYWSYIQVLYAV